MYVKVAGLTKEVLEEVYLKPITTELKIGIKWCMERIADLQADARRQTCGWQESAVRVCSVHRPSGRCRCCMGQDRRP